jgi:hypothetical protein
LRELLVYYGLAVFFFFPILFCEIIVWDFCCSDW